MGYTIPETNSSHLKTNLPCSKVVFQVSIFRGELLVSGGLNGFLCLALFVNCCKKTCWGKMGKVGGQVEGSYEPKGQPPIAGSHQGCQNAVNFGMDGFFGGMKRVSSWWLQPI